MSTKLTLRLAIILGGLTALWAGGGEARQKRTTYVQVVEQATPTINLASSAADLPHGSSVTFTVTLSGKGSPPTGTVVLFNGVVPLGEAALNASGIATYITSNLPSGNDRITADYQGDSNYTSAVSAPLAVSVRGNSPGVTVTPFNTNPSLAQPIIVFVIVSGGSGEPTPTGTVTLSCGSYVSAPVTLGSDGSATIPIPAGSLPVGPDTLTVVFKPDSGSAPIYGEAASSAVVNVVTGFTITATPVSLAAGASVGNASTITVTPNAGFKGSVTLSAEVTGNPVGAQNLPTLLISPNPVVITAGQPGTATLTVTTTRAGGQSASIDRKGRGWQVAGSALACVLLFWTPGRRRWRTMLAGACLLLFLTLGSTACGGSGSLVALGGNGGTTPGSYTVTVTGIAGTETATGKFILTVQ